MPRTRAVVTGIGVVACNGVGTGAFLEALRQGIPGFRPAEYVLAEGLVTRMAGEVAEVAPVPGPAGERAWAMTRLAADEALAQAGLPDGGAGLDPVRVGVVLGTCTGWHGVELPFRQPDATDRAIGEAATFGPEHCSALLARYVGARGPVRTVVTACAAGTNSVGIAIDLIRSGRCDVVVAGGAEALVANTLAGFNILQALSADGCRPFDHDRSGILIGEGAGILVIESERFALQRGAAIQCELLGYGISNDAYHQTSPDPEAGGAVRAIQSALADGGITPDEVGYVNAHGTGTVHNDAMEYRALERIFGDRLPALPVSSTKSMTGHCIGAAGSIELVATVLAIREQFAPPTINTRTPLGPMDLVPERGRPARITAALSNSFAFGGHATCIVAGEYRPAPPGDES